LGRVSSDLGMVILSSSGLVLFLVGRKEPLGNDTVLRAKHAEREKDWRGKRNEFSSDCATFENIYVICWRWRYGEIAWSTYVRRRLQVRVPAHRLRGPEWGLADS
jgi:hypothetical protein